MKPVYQLCWFCGLSIRVDKGEWVLADTGWSGQPGKKMVHRDCDKKNTACRDFYNELKANYAPGH